MRDDVILDMRFGGPEYGLLNEGTPRRNPSLRASRRRLDRPGLRRQVDGRHDSDGAQRRVLGGLESAVRTSGRRARS